MRNISRKPGVDLEERDRPVLTDEELARSSAGIAGGPEDIGRGGTQLLVLLGGEERRGCLLDQLLVPPLQRAVPGGHDDHVAVSVGQALRLNVPRSVQVALDETLAPAEGRDRLAHRRLKLRGNLLGGPGDFEATAAAAECRLDRDRQAVLRREGPGFLGAADRSFGTGGEGGADLLGDVPGLHLVAERLDRRRWRADPGQPRVDDRTGEVGVLGQESVSGVDRVRAAVPGSLEDLGDVQVALGRGLAAQGVCLVGHADVQSVQVNLAVYGHADEPGIPAGPHNPDRDLAAVGDQDLAHVRILPSTVRSLGEEGPPARSGLQR
jgi:hypothetical protein